MVSCFERGLHSVSFQTHEMFSFSGGDLGGEFSGYGCITRHAGKQRSDLLTYDQTEADLG